MMCHEPGDREKSCSTSFVAWSRALRVRLVRDWGKDEREGGTRLQVSIESRIVTTIRASSIPTSQCVASHSRSVVIGAACRASRQHVQRPRIAGSSRYPLTSM